MKDYSEVLAKAVTLDHQGKLQLILRWYHKCDLTRPIGVSDFGAGFPNLPIVCSRCGDRLLNYDEIGFELAILVPSDSPESVTVLPHDAIVIPEDEQGLIEFEAKYLSEVVL